MRPLKGENLMALKLTSLGELNAVGERNCLSIEHPKGAILLDFGIKVPFGQQNSADSGFLPDEFYPDMAKVTKLLKDGRLLAVLESHGHLDHAGGYDRLLSAGVCPLTLASTFTSEVIRQKILRGSGVNLKFATATEASVGPFSVTRFPALHSIPGSSGFFVEADGIGVLYTGDIKTGVLARGKSAEKYSFYTDSLKSFGGAVKYLILDCTNVYEEGYAGIEEDVALEIEKILGENPKSRVFISLISSNVLRIKNIIRAASVWGRPVYVGGASIREILRIAQRRTGWKTLDRFSAEVLPQNAVVIVTGCQGESGSFLSSISSGTLKMNLRVRGEDALVISSDTIPMPEIEHSFSSMITALSGIFGKIYLPNATPAFKSMGARLIRRENLHVSGHGKLGDLREIMRALKPEVVIPYHGELERRRRMAEFVKNEFGAESIIMEQDRVFDLTL